MIELDLCRQALRGSDSAATELLARRLPEPVVQVLVLHAKDNNERAKELLVRAHHGLIYKKVTPDEQLHGAAVYGLLKAVKVFDPSRGYKFATLAVVLMRREVKRAPETNSLIHFSREEYTALEKLEKAVEQLTAVYHRMPKPQELALALGWTEERVTERLMEAYLRDLDSLQAPLGALDSGATKEDITFSPGQRSTESQGLAHVTVSAALHALSEPQRDIALLRTQGDEDPEIAETLDTPLGTVKSRGDRAKAKVYPHLFGEEIV